MERALLAYDDSPKAREALFVATYLVGRWDVELVVVTVSAAEEDANPTVLAAKDYLRAHGVQAQFDVRKGDPADGILAAAKENRSDLLVLGGYHASSLVEIVIGSTLDDMLRRCEMPMLICR
jgi:nucleotide-binding universal stress UspA family protein